MHLCCGAAAFACPRNGCIPDARPTGRALRMPVITQSEHHKFASATGAELRACHRDTDADQMSMLFTATSHSSIRILHRSQATRERQQHQHKATPSELYLAAPTIMANHVHGTLFGRHQVAWHTGLAFNTAS
jgi:hypothetical protein